VLRLLFYFVVFYLVWRIARWILTAVIGPPQNRQATRARHGHAPDFSDVPEADFEDITPPRDEKRDSSTSSTS
jgi:hypothetical protein